MTFFRLVYKESGDVNHDTLVSVVTISQNMYEHQGQENATEIYSADMVHKKVDI